MSFVCDENALNELLIFYETRNIGEKSYVI